MNLTPSDSEKTVLAGIWREQEKADGPAIDLSSKMVIAPDGVEGASVQSVERAVLEILGWPQWVRLYAKPPQAVISAGKWAQSRGLPSGICWMAPGAGAPFDPPSGEPGVFILRADWTESTEKLQQTADQARQKGGLLIVDESSTGFRLAAGGAVEAHGLEPDAVLYVFALPGGRKIAMLAGRGGAAPDAKKPPQDDVLNVVAGLLQAVGRMDTAARIAELGRLFCVGLEYYCQQNGLTDEVTIEGPMPMPRLSGRRVWAFFQLAREEGLFLEPLVLFGADMEPGDMPNLVWRRLARAIARLRVLPEGAMAPKGWKEAAPSKCLRVDEILRSLD